MATYVFVPDHLGMRNLLLGGTLPELTRDRHRLRRINKRVSALSACLLTSLLACLPTGQSTYLLTGLLAYLLTRYGSLAALQSLARQKNTPVD